MMRNVEETILSKAIGIREQVECINEKKNQ